MRFSHWLAGSSNRQPRPLIGPYICNTFADLSVTANSTAPILCVYGCISADFVLNYGHKSRFNLLRSVVFELFVMLMGGGGLGSTLELWSVMLVVSAGCRLWSVMWWLWFWSVISGLVLTGQYPCQAGRGPVCTRSEVIFKKSSNLYGHLNLGVCYP